jgi:hypothetical protein
MLSGYDGCMSDEERARFIIGKPMTKLRARTVGLVEKVDDYSWHASIREKDRSGSRVQDTRESFWR